MSAALYVALAFVYALFSTFGINLAGGENYETYTVNYGSGSSEVMDIYVPGSAGDNEYNGVVLNIHGGSWVEGTRKARLGNLLSVAGDGYICASMDYTTYTSTNGATAFTMMDEIDMAITQIMEFSDEHNLNITKLALMGYSAGAHLAALYAYTRADTCPLDLVFLSIRVCPSDFHNDAWGSGGTALASMLSGVNITQEMIDDGSAEEIIRSVSPACQITSDSVPTLAGFGSIDPVVSSGNAQSMKKALEASGIDYTLIMYKTSGHALFLNPGTASKFKKVQSQYLLKYFGY